MNFSGQTILEAILINRQRVAFSNESRIWSEANSWFLQNFYRDRRFSFAKSYEILQWWSATCSCSLSCSIWARPADWRIFAKVRDSPTRSSTRWTACTDSSWTKLSMRYDFGMIWQFQFWIVWIVPSLSFRVWKPLPNSPCFSTFRLPDQALHHWREHQFYQVSLLNSVQFIDKRMTL